MHLRIPSKTFCYKYFGALHLRDSLRILFCYKYYGALHLRDSLKILFCYKYYGALHLYMPLQTFIYKYYGATHLIGLFDTIEQQIIGEDFWFIQSSRAAKYL